MSAVAALAVASPFAVSVISAAGKPAPEQHDFVQAAMITDLPSEIMSALQSSLSQFGVVVPNMPSGIMGPSTTATPGLAATPGALTTPGLTTPGLTAPGLTAPAAGVPPATATTPGLLDPALTTPALTDPALANPALTNPTPPPTPPGTPGAAPAGLTTPPTGLTTPTTGLTPPAPGLTAPTTGLNPALTSPIGATPGLTGVPGEVPISAPLGPDPLAGTYPILGDPSLGMSAMPAAAPSGGLLGELDSVVSQLGGTQAIDLLKGVVVPSIMQAIKGAVPAPAAAPAAVPPAPVPAPAPAPAI